MARPFGSVNKASGAVKELAQRYGRDAIQRLADLAGLGAPGAIAESQMAQIVALRELLDRGFGKAAQSITSDVTLRRSLTEITDNELLAIVVPHETTDDDAVMH
jgi:hypothetical protein